MDYREPLSAPVGRRAIPEASAGVRVLRCRLSLTALRGKLLSTCLKLSAFNLDSILALASGV